MDKRKEREVLTKCRGGGGEGCAEAGLQVNDFGVFRFFSQIFASTSLLLVPLFFGLGFIVSIFPPLIFVVSSLYSVN